MLSFTRNQHHSEPASGFRPRKWIVCVNHSVNHFEDAKIEFRKHQSHINGRRMKVKFKKSDMLFRIFLMLNNLIYKGDVRSATCAFPVKYLGCVEVFESRGMQVCEEAIKVLRVRFNQILTNYQNLNTTFLEFPSKTDSRPASCERRWTSSGR